MGEDRLSEMDRHTCEQLLAGARVGRVALNDDPSPTVLPVSFRFHDGGILFWTADGRKLDAARAGEAASFEADGYHLERHSGWSVLVRGALQTLDSASEEAEAARDLSPLVDGERPHLVRLEVAEMTGRRVQPDRSWSDADLPFNTWHDQDGTDLLG